MLWSSLKLKKMEIFKLERNCSWDFFEREWVPRDERERRKGCWVICSNVLGRCDDGKYLRYGLVNIVGMVIWDYVGKILGKREREREWRLGERRERDGVLTCVARRCKMISKIICLIMVVLGEISLARIWRQKGMVEVWTQVMREESLCWLW